MGWFGKRQEQPAVPVPAVSAVPAVPGKKKPTRRSHLTSDTQDKEIKKLVGEHYKHERSNGLWEYQDGMTDVLIAEQINTDNPGWHVTKANVQHIRVTKFGKMYEKEVSKKAAAAATPVEGRAAANVVVLPDVIKPIEEAARIHPGAEPAMVPTTITLRALWLAVSYGLSVLSRLEGVERDMNYFLEKAKRGE